MWIKKSYRIEEVAQIVGIEERIILSWIENEWLSPAEVEQNELDEEDLARARLIQNLRADFGVNDEAVAIILHLLDQLHCLQSEVRKRNQ